jgi:hypothetical protein
MTGQPKVSIRKSIQKLQLDLLSYREAVDKIFSSALTKPQSWQRCFRDILICASQLYLDYLLFIKRLPTMEAISSRRASCALRRLNTHRQKSLREKLHHKLESSVCWSRDFKPENAFSDLTGLRNLRDYTDRLTIHLPEIYMETFRVEACAKDFLATRDASALAQLVVGLQHLGQHHISFVLQTLEWASDEGSWDEHSAASKASLRMSVPT